MILSLELARRIALNSVYSILHETDYIRRKLYHIITLISMSKGSNCTMQTYPFDCSFIGGKSSIQQRLPFLKSYPSFQ